MLKSKYNYDDREELWGSISPGSNELHINPAGVEHQLTAGTSHSRIALSSDPDANIRESGLHAMVDIPAKCPSRV